jgi:polyphosphate kinase
MKNKKKYLNRELSWLSFNERVLQEAADPTVPLVERVRFLGIFSNNQDEFFRVRVASLWRMIDIASVTRDNYAENPKKILLQVRKKVVELETRFRKIYLDIFENFEKEGIQIIDEEELTPVQALFVETYIRDFAMPYMCPILLRNVHHFPPLKDRSIYFAIKLMKKDNRLKREYALLEIPANIVGRFIVLPPKDDKKQIILLDDAIRHCLKQVFNIFDYDEFKAYTIKITRDAELDIDSDLTQSFLEKISKSVSNRTKGQPVRFLYDETMPKDLLKYIVKKIDIDEFDALIAGGRYHNFKDFMGFPNVGRKSLEYSPTPPLVNYDINENKDIFKLVEKKDVLLHFPYQRFLHLIDILREAALSPNVTEIKITLYRVAKNSKIVNALINAARNGKKVTAVIELQARFDEESNIFWSKRLEEEGVNVQFGMKGLKVHAKLLLIRRKEKKSLKDYVCVSTGNFHESNANVYTDLTVFTCNKDIAEEVDRVFEMFESPFKNYQFNHLLVAPIFMRNRLVELIDNEIQNAKKGKPAYIILKLNNIVDNNMIDKLYEADKAGVNIQLIIRGICCIRSGVQGLSENIETRSIVDKFLEHSRVFIFCNNNHELYYISSADWMTRNLDYRIEVACPVYDNTIRKVIRDNINIQLRDNVKARMLTDGHENEYYQSSESAIRSQMAIYERYRKLIKD